VALFAARFDVTFIPAHQCCPQAARPRAYSLRQDALFVADAAIQAL